MGSVSCVPPDTEGAWGGVWPSACDRQEPKLATDTTIRWPPTHTLTSQGTQNPLQDTLPSQRLCPPLQGQTLTLHLLSLRAGAFPWGTQADPGALLSPSSFLQVNKG